MLMFLPCDASFNDLQVQARFGSYHIKELLLSPMHSVAASQTVGPFLGAAYKVKVSQNNVASSNLFNQLHEGILKIASPPLSHSGSGRVAPGQAWSPSMFHPPRAHPVQTQAQPSFSLAPKGLVKSRPFRNTATTETQPNQSPSSDSTQSARSCQAYHFCTGDIPTSQPPASNTRWRGAF